MKSKVSKYFEYAFYSFPIQLLILHVKKHPLLLMFWVVLFGFILQLLGVNYGIPLLFFEPEYLNNVNFFSFLLIGFSMGGFITAWNISFYILNSYRFEFLASSVNPFVQFCLNNSIIPLAFTIVYIVKLVQFQHTENFFSSIEIIKNIAALLTGNLLMVVAVTVLFIFFNQDVETFINKLSDKAKESLIGKKIHLDKMQFLQHHSEQWKVETFLTFPFKIKLVRKVDFYDRKLVERVLFLHHRFAFVFQIICILGLFGLGFFIDIPYFRLPAIAAGFLIFSVATVFFSFLSFFFRGWATIAFLSFIFILNILTKYDLIVYKHKLFGLDYNSQKVEYNNEIVKEAYGESTVKKDIQKTTVILNNWAKKNKRIYGVEKPKLIIINSAGGGLKASYWTFHVLQELQLETNKKLYDHTMLLTGASGGMLGAAYFRELYLRKKQNEAVDYLHKTYLDDIGNDLLNGIITSIATNDIFYPWRTYSYNGFEYKKDRAFIFNLKLNENTHYMMNKKMSEYKFPEQKAIIPMMILGATIINDQRFLLFSPQQISYLVKPYTAPEKHNEGFVADAIEFNRLFKYKGASSLNFIDALRTNATYPYLMPTVYFPTQPEIKAMDAGIRDNSGLSVSTRFYSVFKNWIDENTSGVIFITIRVGSKERELNTNEKESYISELLAPVGNIFNNFLLLQDYNSDMALSYLENKDNSNIDVLTFNYDQTAKRKKASMSWHLTNLEKQDIQESFHQKENQLMLKRLKSLLR